MGCNDKKTAPARRKCRSPHVDTGANDDVSAHGMAVRRRNPPGENIKAPGEIDPDEGYFNTLSQPDVQSLPDY